jgi:hypothetical protein
VRRRVRPATGGHAPDHRSEEFLYELKVADAVGQPPTHAAAEPPTVRYIDMLHHALRHLRFLTDPSSIGFDATIAGELDETWQRHLTTFEPTIARMYSREHRPLSPRTGAGPNG